MKKNIFRKLNKTTIGVFVIVLTALYLFGTTAWADAITGKTYTADQFLMGDVLQFEYASTYYSDYPETSVSLYENGTKSPSSSPQIAKYYGYVKTNGVTITDKIPGYSVAIASHRNEVNGVDKGEESFKKNYSPVNVNSAINADQITTLKASGGDGLYTVIPESEGDYRIYFYSPDTEVTSDSLTYLLVDSYQDNNALAAGDPAVFGNSGFTAVGEGWYYVTVNVSNTAWSGFLLNTEASDAIKNHENAEEKTSRLDGSPLLNTGGSSTYYTKWSIAKEVWFETLLVLKWSEGISLGPIVKEGTVSVSYDAAQGSVQIQDIFGGVVNAPANTSVKCPMTTLNFTAVPIYGYQFSHWTNNVDKVITKATYTLHATEVNGLSVAFSVVEKATVTFAAPQFASGETTNSTYTVSGGNLSNEQILAYGSESISVTDYVTSTYTLTAAPEEGYVLDGWHSGSSQLKKGDDSNTWEFTLGELLDLGYDKEQSLCAQFSENYASILFVSPSAASSNGYYLLSHGDITKKMEVGDPDCPVDGPLDYLVTLEAKPYEDADYEFVGWVNAANQPVAYSNPLTKPLRFFRDNPGVVPVFQYKKVRLTFGAVDGAVYTVQLGDSTQTVTSDLEQIGEPGTTVILSLTKTPEDYEFVGWVDENGNVLNNADNWETNISTLSGYKEDTVEGTTVVKRSQSRYVVAPSFKWLKANLTLIPGRTAP